MPLRTDVVTGETVLHRTDLRLPGYIPLTLARTYRSGREQSSSFGYGWQLNLEVTLRVAPDEITCAPGTPHETVFSPIEEEMQARHVTGVLIQHRPEAYAIVPAPSRRLVFTKEKARGDTIPLDRIEDASGNSVHFFYDGERIAGIVDTLGRQIRFDYQGGQVSCIRVVGGEGMASAIRTFQYNGQDDLVKETDAEGYAASFGYQRHLMVAYTCRNGGTQYAQYDDDRRCHILWYADESDVRQFAYDKPRQSTRVMQGDGQQTLYRHVHPDQVLERIDPVDQSQNYYYDEGRQLIGFSDEHEAVQTFQQVDFEEGTGLFMDTEQRVAFFELDEDVRVANVLDAFENQRTLSYDSHNWPVELRTPAGSEWTFRRNNRGAVIEVISPSGRSVQLARHADDQTLVVDDKQGRRIEDHFDEQGRLVERTDALNRRFQWRYDANGWLRSVHVGGQSMTFNYTPGGQPSRIVDATGQETTLSYDAFGRMRRCAIGDRPYQVGYDSAGRVASVTDPQDRTTQLAHTEGGRISQIQYPGGRTATFRRTGDGVEVTTDGKEGEIVTLYNQAGDPVQWKKPGRSERLLDYGPSGELIGIEREEDSLYFDYNTEGRVAEAVGGNQTLRLDYNADGGLEAVHADGQTVLQCTRSSRGRPVELDVSSRIFQLAYDAGDRLQAIQGEGHKWTFGYDALDRLVKIQGPRALEKGSSALDAEGVQTHTVGAPEQSDGEKRTAELEVHIARRGLALSVQIGSRCVPIWGRGDYLSPVLPLSPALVAATLTLGAEPLVAPLRPVFTPRLVQHWEQRIAGGVRDDHTEIPSLKELGCPAWSTLDQFFLNRSFYEMSYLSLLPGEAANGPWKRERSPDSWVTGTHVAGELRPPIWTHRAAGPRLHHRALGPRPRPMEAIDILELVCGATSWK